MTTTAVLTTNEGITLVASSNSALSPIQRSLLYSNEIEVLGQAGVHAEEKLIMAAITSDLTPQILFISRPACQVCQELLNSFKIPYIFP